MSLSAQILVAMLLGLAAGLFFGELVESIKIVGDGFILLLQMTVLPYVSVSLVSGLGSLRAEGAAALAVRAGTALLVLWSLALEPGFPRNPDDPLRVSRLAERFLLQHESGGDREELRLSRSLHSFEPLPLALGIHRSLRGRLQRCARRRADWSRGEGRTDPG
ncbi:MAG: cation:dicarboxylase symporter family transporter, partial [Deltaproteobacteria bacterium]|nr:cation:dicarboxylase symporter family transporter [Deltaproteobacteria bacterium]